MKQRAATIERKTKETDISLTINLDGTGENEIATGIPFFDHMLNGFARHGLFLLPMDETLAMCAVDLSGRPYLNYQAEFTVEKLGTLDTEMIREFFYAVSYSAAMNLHLKIVDGGNNHHMAEALFKAFGKALDMATMEEPRMNGVWSTKGSL